MRIEILALKNLHLDMHKGILECYLYICTWASLQYQPPAASTWQDIIFDMRIDILALKNQHLHMHENILDCYL